MTSRVGVARAGKGIALVITNEDADNIIRILKSLENSGVLIDEVSEIVKSDKKKTTRISWYVIRNFRCFNVKKCFD